MKDLVISLLRVWAFDVKKKFLSGHLVYERQLQAVMYDKLKSRLGQDYEVWVEPVIYVTNKNYVKPDLVITKNNEIMIIIELKFKPWEFVAYKYDLKKLKAFDALAAKQKAVTLGIKPISSDWEKQKGKGYMNYTFNSGILTVFAAVGRPESDALKVLRNKPKHFLHLIGYIKSKANVCFEPR